MMKRSVLPVSVFLAFVSVAEISVAQDTSAPLEEVLVTASKREQSLLVVPSSLQAFSGEDLERAGLSDIGELTQRIPGASVVSKSGAGFETIQLRGISSGTVGDATVGFYIDELAFGVPNLQLVPPSRLIDLERVEVLRGPQGTLYGQGSMGGTIKLITSQPDPDAFLAKLALEGSQTEDGGSNYAVDAAVNLPITDSLALRLSGGVEELSGWATSLDTGEEEINDSESTNFRAKLGWTPSENLTVTASYWIIENDQDFSNLLTTAEPATIFTGRAEDSWIETSADLYSLFISYDLGFATLESGTSYTDYELAFDLGFGVPLAPGLNVSLINQSSFPTETFNQELRLVSNNEGGLNWIVGAFYTDATIDSDIELFFTPDLGGALPPLLDDLGTIDSESYSLFGEVSKDFLDGFMTGLIGVRYFEDDRSARGTSLLTGVIPGMSETFDSVNPRFNLAIRPFEDGMLFVDITKGFRSGTIQTPGQALLPSLVGIDTGIVIDPDELWTYELGAKWSLADGAFIVDAAVYFTDWSDIQIPFDAVGTGLVSVMNGGDAEITGLDLGIVWLTPIEGLSFQATANFNDTEIVKSDAALAATLPTLAEGSMIPGVPETSYFLAGDYRRPLGSTGFDLYGQLSYAYRDEQIDLASGIVSDDIENLGLRVGVERDSWELYLFGDNLTDNRGPSVAALTTVQTPYPRRIGLQLNYRFE